MLFCFRVTRPDCRGAPLSGHSHVFGEFSIELLQVGSCHIEGHLDGQGPDVVEHGRQFAPLGCLQNGQLVVRLAWENTETGQQLHIYSLTFIVCHDKT